MERSEAIDRLRAYVKSEQALKDKHKLTQQVHLLMVYLTQEVEDSILNDKDAEICKEIDELGNFGIRIGTEFIEENPNTNSTPEGFLEKKITVARRLKEMYQMLGRRDFEKFLIAIEWNFKEDMKFYDIRKCVLKEWVKELEKLEYGELMGLSISAPPRAGKTGLGEIFFMWCGLRHPDKSNLFVSHTTAVAEKVYNDIISMINDEKREIGKIFPYSAFISEKNAEYLYLQLRNDSSNPYKTFYFRGIDGNMAGILEASHLLYCDDLIKNIEEAMNPTRLETARMKYGTDIKQRKSNKEVRELHIATRWSTGDVISTLEKENKNNPKWKFLKKPALDENGKSNFMYKHPYELDEEYFEEKRHGDMMDEISFSCLYQQEPLEREGLWVTENDLRYFNGELPAIEPDIVCSACDIAWGGGDYTSMPVAKVYGTAVYIVDVVYDNGTKMVTQPLVIGAILRNEIQKANFEANNGGDEYCDDIKTALMLEHGYKLDISSKKAPARIAKAAKINAVTDEVKGVSPMYQLYFLEEEYRPPMYKKFMKDLFKYNTGSKFQGNQKDDCADSLAQLIMNVLEKKTEKNEARSNYSRSDLGF